MILRWTGGAVIALSLLCGKPAPAQSDAFGARMADALAPAGDRASLLRFTALFRAFRLYAGDDTEVGAIAANREGDLAVIAAIIWQGAENTDMNGAIAAIVPLIDTATDLFVDRFIANDATTGNIFDSGLDAELAYCGTLGDGLMEAFE